MCSSDLWRKRYRAGATEPTALQLMPVTVTPDRPTATAPARANELIEMATEGKRCLGGTFR